MTLTAIELCVLDGPEAGRRFFVPQGAPKRFGTGNAADEVLAPDGVLSPVHFGVYWYDGLARVRDLQSATGTWRNDAPLHDAPLRDGDLLTAGRTRLRAAWHRDDVTSDRDDDPVAARMRDLRAMPGRLYALLDPARSDAVLSLLRRSGQRCDNLYEGWAAEVFEDVAPYLVRTRRDGLFLPMVLREAWGKGYGVFLSSRAPRDEVRRQLRKLVTVRLEGRGRATFRFYDPLVMLGWARTTEPSRLATMMGCIECFAAEVDTAPDGATDDARLRTPMALIARPG